MQPAIDIVKPKTDQREYRYRTLDNKIRVIYIHDPLADMAACALDVNVGAALDPSPLFGTAHFLEHMLFQGTEKYPIENEYGEFISKNGGSNNAFTSLTDTNFHFSISNEAFEECLDRLAQFFISPKFSEDSTDREVNAVDSEFKMALQVDAWHFMNLLQQLSAKGSNLNKFMCGNKDTLSQPGIRESLLDFHKKWYSSNIMTMALVSNHPLDDMEKWVTDKFTPIVNKDIAVPNLCEPNPLPAENLQRVVRYVPVKDENELIIYWVLPYYEKEFSKGPVNYFSHLLGHEGENSLLSYLKDQGWAISLSTSNDHEMSGFSTLECYIKLTTNGLENYEKVVEATFQYLRKINEAGPQDYVFEECKNIGVVQFDFSDRGNPMSTCVSLAGRMQKFNDGNMDQILRTRYVRDVFDKELNKEVNGMLIDPTRTAIFLRSKSFADKTDQVAEYFSTNYSVEPFPAELVEKMTNPNAVITTKKLDLPPVNKLIPTNFDLLPEDTTVSKEPVQLKKWDSGILWYLKDDTFKKPKASVQMQLHTCDNDFGVKKEARMFAIFWKEILQEFLQEFNYMAECANLDSGIAIANDHVSFEWSGFNDSMPNFITDTIGKVIEMRGADLKKEFAAVKEKKTLEWKNKYLDQSFRQMMPLLETTLIKSNPEFCECSAWLEGYTYEMFMQEQQTWLKNGFCEFLIVGNIDKSVAIDMTEKAAGHLSLGPFDPTKQEAVCTMKLPCKKTVSFVKNLVDSKNENSCTVTAYQAGKCDTIQANKHNMLTKLVGQYLEEPFFDDLRTKQQLGYVVAERVGHRRLISDIWFLVQSPAKCPEYLLGATNKFLLEKREVAKNLEEKEFKEHKSGLSTIIAEKDKKITEVAYRYSVNELGSHRYVWTRQADELAVLESITLDDFKAHFEKLFFSDETRRIDIQLVAENHKADQEAAAKINDEEDAIFKDLPRVKYTSLDTLKSESEFYENDYAVRLAQMIKDGKLTQ